MNRQVGPSIVLSVLIVCFFAVALFQPDPPRSAGDRRRSGSADSIARAGPATTTSARRSVRSDAAGAGTARSARPAGPPGSVARAGDRSVAPADPGESGFSARPAARRSVAAGAGKPARIERVFEPDSEFTVVRANETIEDVALRVYGSTGQVDSLWRANRDSLSRRDSPLAAGAVLRTPTLR